MKISTVFLLLILLSCKNSVQEKKIKNPSEYFPQEKAKVLVVGSFHFDYPNLDAVKTNDNDKIDVLKEPRKSEVTELINYIKKFKPTKIAIEAFDDWNVSDKLEQYRKGKYRNERDERFQIALRIANEMNIKQLYSADASTFVEDLMKVDSAYTEKLFEGFDFESDDIYAKLVNKWYKEEEKNLKHMKLLDYFKRINSRESHLLGYGSYLVGDFKLDNGRGADILSVWWYNRNLRIFRKIQEITTSKNDRILVLFGNGHAAILRQLFECSPEYAFVEFDKL